MPITVRILFGPSGLRSSQRDLITRLLAVTLAVLFCSSARQKEDYDMKRDAGMVNDVRTSDTLALQATFLSAGEQLDVSYTLDNRSDEDVYVLDRLFRVGQGGISVDTSMVYTLVDGKMLTLFRGMVPSPYGTQVESPDVPLARLVRSGEKVTDSLRAKIPLRYDYPYQWINAPALVETHQIRLRIGYVRRQDVPSPKPVVVNSIILYRVTYRQAREVQQLVETPHQELIMRTALQP